MFRLPGVRKFYDWTHASLTPLLNHLSTIPATEYAKEVPGFGFPTVCAQVIHILNCEGFGSTLCRRSPSMTRTLPIGPPSPTPDCYRAKSA